MPHRVAANDAPRAPLEDGAEAREAAEARGEGPDEGVDEEQGVDLGGTQYSEI